MSHEITIRDGYGYEFGIFRSEELGIYIRGGHCFFSFLRSEEPRDIHTGRLLFLVFPHP